MSINFRAVRGLRQQPLLVCVSTPAFDYSTVGGYPLRAAANVGRLIKLWETREAPYTAVRSGGARGQNDLRPGGALFEAGELVFDSVRCSLLRNHKFRSFHDDIGAPPIMMIGGGLESTIVATAIDAYWFNIQLTVIGDAVYPARNLTVGECGTVLKILSNFVDVVNLEFVEND
ncbi:hypothetical protein [Methylocystis bryophila]|uniref:hypothetical protein n=1 Tax=Methylocystis bryophila TaxID=655015 RepID=UPI001319CE8E|nr:hypothetical protein [Methylocystis bryophila]BDV39261.1 hypothetical protein DSM21852_25140 [Methylocystis bryophila]